MTTVALLHNHYEESKLKKVIEEMKALGAPVIRVYDLGFDNIIQAIEGCHRLRACEELGIDPILEYVDGETLLSELDLDYDGAAGKVNELGDWENYSIEII